jgi:hypothetical protein
MSGKLGFLIAGIPEAEREARCRELWALALVYLGPRHPATVALAEAVADAAAGPRALLALLDAAPALPRRRLLSTYGALTAPSGARHLLFFPRLFARACANPPIRRERA